MGNRWARFTMCAILPIFTQVIYCQGAAAVPPLPFYQEKACPYEYCRYGDVWTAHQPLTVYDTWKDGRRAIDELAVGDHATGIAGLVVTSKPGTIRMDRDLANVGLRSGDVVLTYGASSEGFSAVWLQGRFYSAFDISFAKLPDGSGCGGSHCAATFTDLGKKSWWVEVKLASGRTGWVEMELGRRTIALY